MFPGQQQNLQGHSATGEDPIILPHDRVGSDFSWLQGPSQKDHKERDFEADESFLYANEESKSSEIFSCRERHDRAQDPQHQHLRNVQQHLRNTPRIASALLDSNECEKIKSILKCLGSADTVTGQALEASFSKGESPALKVYVCCLLIVEGLYSRLPSEVRGAALRPPPTLQGQPPCFWKHADNLQHSTAAESGWIHHQQSESEEHRSLSFTCLKGLPGYRNI